MRINIWFPKQIEMLNNLIIQHNSTALRMTVQKANVPVKTEPFSSFVKLVCSSFCWPFLGNFEIKFRLL